MHEYQEVFVETTSQILRLCGDSRQKEKIESFLSTSTTVYTSSTVYLEFLRTIVWAFQIVRRTIAESEPCQDALIRLADIDRWLSETTFAHSERQVRSLFKVTSALKEKYGQEYKITCGEVIEYIDGVINRLIKKWFFVFGTGSMKADIRQTGGFINLTNCELVEQAIKLDIPSRARLSCSAKDQSCSIYKLLAERKIDIQKVKVAFDLCTDDRKDKDALEALDKVIDKVGTSFQKKATALGQRICWKLGDVIIGLECPAGAKLLSSDKHFSVICPALGEKLLPLKDVLN